MSLYLRNNIWWMEYRTKNMRVRKSTGLKKSEKVKAKAVWQAWKLAFVARPSREVFEKMINAVYRDATTGNLSLALSEIMPVYMDWLNGKSRELAVKTLRSRRSAIRDFVEWAERFGVKRIDAVSVAIARQYVKHIQVGRGNKTVRNRVLELSTIWEAIHQMNEVEHNPWKAALPDDNGTSVTRFAFSPDDERRILDIARQFGHGWYLASMISRWTGLRYGDVANLEWIDLDLERQVIETIPNKTRRHNVSVMVPISDQLLTALQEIPANQRKGQIFPEHAAVYPKGFKDRSFGFGRILEQAGLDTKHYTFHSWRHTFRTRLAEAGVSDDVARRLGGWTNLAMAGHYDHAHHLDEMREAIKRASQDA